MTREQRGRLLLQVSTECSVISGYVDEGIRTQDVMDALCRSLDRLNAAVVLLKPMVGEKTVDLRDPAVREELEEALNRR